jgi:mRNA degradation ribonuclease J1/J2
MHPIELSTKVIDSGIVDQPLNRVTNDITELADNLAIVESFSHSVVWDTGDGLMCFDASGAGSGIAVVDSIRSWRKAPISHLVYTHGHADHVGGSFAFAKDAEKSGAPKPHVIGHEDVDDVHYDLADDLDLLFLKEDSIGLLKDKLVAQLLKILNHTKQLLVLVKDESMELVLRNGVQNTQQDKRGYRNDLKILTFFVERLQDILREAADARPAAAGDDRPRA